MISLLSPGKKAAHTLRINRLSRADRSQVHALCEEIRALEFQIDDDFSRDGIISREVAPTTWKSFCRYGDRKQATAPMILIWIRDSGMPLDEQAMWIEENYNLHVTPDELAAFIIEHDRGKSMYEPYRKLADLKRIFKEVTGFRYNPKFVKHHILQAVTDDEEMPF